MYEPQQLLDLQDNNGGFGAGADSSSWLSGEDRSPTLRRTDSSLSNSAAGTVDRTLFNDLVQIVPLVQSLIVILFFPFWVCFFSSVIWCIMLNF